MARHPVQRKSQSLRSHLILRSHHARWSPPTQVHTFDSTTPLFIFSFEDKILRQALFATSNSVDFFCWLTNEAVVVFDISLNAYSRIVEIQEFDIEIRQLCLIRKSEKEQSYLLCLGMNNLLVYDLSLSKIERIEIENRVF
jgi:hypothetical protein